ncbi:unnamed protein product [Cylicostephanus goldi]|uniref:Uncharacterized protein n=1 Tax=Cylicostephanus goldi TaxID=71465 RepID=A0A3P7PMR5_CYLGO|nr:unnamed protein product [Cylicostephanus goldi]
MKFKQNCRIFLLLISLAITSELAGAAERVLRKKRENYGPFEGGPGYGRAIFPASTANHGNMWGTGIGTSVNLRLGGYNNGFLLNNSVVTVSDMVLTILQENFGKTAKAYVKRVVDFPASDRTL